MRKLKDELALAQSTVKQLKDSEVGFLVKCNAQQKEIERVTKENRELIEQVRQLREKKVQEEEKKEKTVKQKSKR